MAIGDVEWDVSTARPIIDGKTINPTTGAVQPSSIQTTYTQIDMFWHNMRGDRENGYFRGSRGPTGPSIDALFVRIAKVVEEGWVTLHSVTFTQYTCVVVCESEMTDIDFGKVVYGHTGW
ncbi:hypothetical protein LTR62_001226 [Meristemomyces frigidus]|uniref:Uncharacterized protein n=1 Tax=Meristemomyces frigidus TaxID=1508187 RepID=A0AAN7THH3_9PEZI|nr:hypothetical protein LTR62_001226 [Meristemomyces frigidus]